MAKRRIGRQRPKPVQTGVKVLCCVCSQYFHTPKDCLEHSDWNVCLSCLEEESNEIRARLAKRGIILPNWDGSMPATEAK